MKIPTLSVILPFALFAQGVAAKSCHTGVDKACPKGQICVAPSGSPPGAEGVCGKTCASGTEKPCPKGQVCIVEDQTMPGASGGCVAENLCFEEYGRLYSIENELADRIVDTYENIFDEAWKNLMKQAVNPPAQDMCSEQVQCTGNGTFCLPHLLNPSEGICYTGYEMLGMCRAGTENSCPNGEVCMTATAAAPGSLGFCFPKGSKTCHTGTAKPCSKGYSCIPLVPGLPGGDGVCVSDDECVPQESYISLLEYWQFEESVSIYNNLDTEHQAYIIAEINK